MKICTLSIKYWKNNPKTVGFLQVICILQYIQHILLIYRVDRLPVNFVTIQSRHKTKKMAQEILIDRTTNRLQTDICKAEQRTLKWRHILVTLPPT